jgi:hypothetical protein
MLFYLTFLRDQIRKTEQDARRRRLLRQLAAARRWERIAQYAAKRAKEVYPTNVTDLCR